MCDLCQFEVEVSEFEDWKLRSYLQIYLTDFDERAFQSWLTEHYGLREFELTLSSYIREPIKGHVSFTEHRFSGFYELTVDVLENWMKFCGKGNPDIKFTPISALPTTFKREHKSIDVQELTIYDAGGYAVISADDEFWTIKRSGCLTQLTPLSRS